MALNFSIGDNPVLDCNLSGWPDDKRQEYQTKASKIAGVARSGGAGISTVRIWHETNADKKVLSTELTKLANDILPGHQFSC